MVGNPDYDPEICNGGTIGNYKGMTRDDSAFRGESVPIPKVLRMKPDIDRDICPHGIISNLPPGAGIPCLFLGYSIPVINTSSSAEDGPQEGLERTINE